MEPQGRGHRRQHRGHPHWCRHMERTGSQYGAPRARAQQAAQGTSPLVQAYGANREPIWSAKGETRTGAGVWSEQVANMGTKGKGTAGSTGDPPLVQAYGANRQPIWRPKGEGTAGGTGDTPTGAGI